jgi:uncharacterized protein YjgD (DUF1641 family)
MNGDFLDLLNKKISEPEGKLQLESILGNLNTVSDTLQWVKTLQETGMAESLKGVAYLLANLRSILTDDMLNGVSSMLNSLLEVLSKISDPQVVEGLVSLLDGIASGKLSQDPKIHGTFSLLGELKDPEVEAGLAVAINMIKGLGKIGKH